MLAAGTAEFKAYFTFCKEGPFKTRRALACNPPSVVAVEMKFENYKVIQVKSAQLNLKLYQRDISFQKWGN